MKTLNTMTEVCDAYARFDFAGALDATWRLISDVDVFLTEKKPWAIAKDATRSTELKDTLFTAAETLLHIVVLAHPVIPDATEAIWKHLGQTSEIGKQRINEIQWGSLKPGTRVQRPTAVFPRADKKEASERIEIMENEIRNPGSTQPASTPIPATTAGGAGAAPAAAPVPGAKISIEDFAKVELRVGIVKSAEKVQGADKLLKVMVDIGDEVRQVLAGIAQHYVPEELVGRKVVVVANLAPRKMRGQESNGMIVAASVGPEGRPVLCTFTEDVPAGAKLK
jgi:methionyl-tRNA synthetase